MKCSYIALLLLGLAACKPTAPQRPTFKGQATAEDSAFLQAVELNKHMAEQADAQLLKYSDGYSLMEDNYWVKGLTSHTSDLQDNDAISLHARFYRLDGTLVADHEAETIRGKIDDIQAIVLVTPLLARGDSVSLLVPWYLAFGSTGQGNVPPYENIRVELTIQ